MELPPDGERAPPSACRSWPCEVRNSRCARDMHPNQRSKTLLLTRRVLQDLEAREVAILLVARSFHQLELCIALERDCDRPRPRIHHRICDSRLVVDRIRASRRESLHHVLGVADDLAALVQPRLA